LGNELLFIGIIATSFLIFFIISKISISDENFKWVNVGLQIFGLGMIIILMILLPKVVMDDKDFCAVLVKNATISGSTTSYDYERTCFDNPNTTSTIFYKIVFWFLRVIVFFLGIYFIMRTVLSLTKKYPRIK
jgi:hypothetical protein